MTFRIRVVENDHETHKWPFTAWLERWDGTEWRGEAAEDGDTSPEAVAELRAQNHRARSTPMVG